MINILMIAALAVPQVVAVTSDTSKTTITLEQALQIALSENATVQVADKEIEVKGYSRKGTYAALFPQISASGSFNRTLKKQVMTIDMGGQSQSFEVGRWNTINGGVSASMPIINAQLWKSLEISGEDVELAIEQARNSRLQMVTQVKQAYYTALLAKEAHKVYKSVYENALANCALTEKKYNASKASELDLTRAKTAVANAVPHMYDSENAIILALWRLKALMGVDLDMKIDVADSLLAYSEGMAYMEPDNLDFSNNSSLKQLELQAEVLANSIKLQTYANLPSLALSFSYQINAMENEFNFSEYKWHPYAMLGLSLNVPIFTGGRNHNKIKQTKVQQQQLAIQREDAERNLRVGLMSNLNTMDMAGKSYFSAVEALESANKAYGIASKSYEVGRSTLTDLNDAQLALTQARLAVSQAVYNFLNAKASLEQTLGIDYDLQENLQ
jgi:outer membrane protein TolC